MDFTFAPPPRLQPPFGPDTTFDNPDYPVFLFPPRLPVGARVGQLPFRLYSTSFKMLPFTRLAEKIFLGATFTAVQPGVFHVAIDVVGWEAFFRLGNAVEWLKEQVRLDSGWGEKTRDELLRDSLFQYLADKPHLWPMDGNVTLVVEIPPMHLVDP